MSTGSILIFDADKPNRDYIEAFVKSLAPKNWIVVSAQDEQNFLNRTRNKTFEMIVLAQKNQKMSGPFLIKNLLEAKQTPPHIICMLLNTDEKAEDVLFPSLMTIKTPASDDALKEFFIQAIKKLETFVEAEAKAAAGPKVDASFINPFIESTVKVLELTCKVTAQKETVFLRKGDQSNGDISALIGITSQNLRGSLSITFEKSCFLHVVSEMLGEPQKEITPENQDAAGEICNQVFGMAKTILNETGFTIQPAIPSVIVGPNHRVKHMNSGPVIAVRFKTNSGFFIVEAAIGT